MKKLIVLFLALSTVFAFSAKAQNTVTIDDVVASPGAVNVPIDVDFGVVTDVCTFDLTVNFDNSQLTWVGIANVNGSLPAPAPTVSVISPSKIKISWVSGTTGASFAGKLLDMQFTYAGGNSAITFSAEAAGVTELGDCAGPSPISTTFTNGSISAAVAVPVSNWAIFLGIGLIVVFTAVGFRRYFFA